PSGLNWGPSSFSATCNGQSGTNSCTVTGAQGSQKVHCDLGNWAQFGNCTITVSSPTQTTAPAECVPAPGLLNTGTAAAGNADAVQDSGSQSCVLPNLIVQKTPKNGTYSLGDTISFTIVVTNNGQGTAHNVRYNPLDSLPDPNHSLNWGPAN